MSRSSKRAADIGFAAISIEGGLIAPEQLAVVASATPGQKTAADYGCPKGTSLRDEITRYFRIGQAHWHSYAGIEAPTTTQTAAFVKVLLEQAFGFVLTGPVTHDRDDRRYRIAWEAKGGRVPIVVAAPITGEKGKTAEGFTRALPEFGDGMGGGAAKRSPVVLLQDWLNANVDANWGLVFAGDRVRLMRDNASFTRPAYIESDLGAIFRDEMFADFTATWLLLHATRFGSEGASANDSPLESWREAGQRAGTAVRERLRGNVEDALLVLGQGFLDANNSLRERLDTGELPMQQWFEQLLRLVYRLIFLAVAEDRDLLHAPATSPTTKNLYGQHYGFAFLRDRSARRGAHDHHHDGWDGARIVFQALERGEALLGLPALGGLFARGLTPDLDEAELSNRALMGAVFKLGWLIDEGRRVRINWRDMATEELGSVYEGLLELVPTREDDGQRFCFAGGNESRGNARKISGSYYTPDSLVQTLLDDTLDPVLARAEAEGGAHAILKLSVIDPACGSGHFLLGAARRMATRVALLRDSEAPDYPAAMRDVVRHCIHGVDRNPMAVELAKVAMWIEAVEPGKPLTFLDSHIRCGDSLVGVFDLSVLGEGIPDDAYKPLNGDDREVVNYYKAKNRREQAERDRVESGFGFNRQKDLARDLTTLADMPEETVDQITEKRSRFEALLSQGAAAWTLERVCDLWISAFFSPKASGGQYADVDGLPRRGAEMVATSGTIWELLRGREPFGPLAASAASLADENRFFHWPIAFANIIGRGGFDVVIGNPPWEMPEADDREFFTMRVPSIAAEPTAQKRRVMIAALAETNAHEYGEWQQYTRGHAASRSFFSESNRFPNGANGRLNYYKLFLENAFFSISKKGRLGMVIPSGLTTNAYERPLWHSFVNNGFVSAIYDFENSKGLFAGIDSRVKFSLIVLTRRAEERFRTACWLSNVADLREPDKVVVLGVDDLARFSPDDLALPQFRRKADLDLLVFASRRHGQISDHDDWAYTPRLMFSSSDSAFKPVDIRTLPNARYTKENRIATSSGDTLVPVFEGKMVGILDHRQADIYINPANAARQAQERPISDAEKTSPDRFAVPQFWLEEEAVRRRRFGKRQGDWELVFCDVTSATNERTTIASITPLCGLTRSLPSIYLRSSSAKDAALLAGALSSTVVDYYSRLKVSSNHLTQGILATLPLPSRSKILEFADKSLQDIDWFEDRVFELSYVSWDLSGFAKDAGRNTAPFRWNAERRFLLRCEIDAAFFYLILGSSNDWQNGDNALTGSFETPRQAVEYILSSFPTLNRKDEIRFDGDQRTRRTVLEIYDELTLAISAKQRYQTRLSPAPADPSCCHPAEGASVGVPARALFDGMLARPAQAQPGDVGAVLAAILKAMDGPKSIRDVRLTAALVLEPRLLVPILPDAQASEWRRLVGSEADPLVSNVAAFAVRNNAAWGAAVRNHRGNGRLLEDILGGTWAPGDGLDAIDLAGWPDGRVGFVLTALRSINLDTAARSLPDEIQRWITDAAAA
ncbi:Eco57I restriction-modification methylase domain-containing protein [Sphingomonas sp. CFBP 8764]|uniref:Eco57I restriction-modification methylase domain-containing protein n=1 Tax=Sphingomonas sp. CFBP 8764 TaxID=2775275 RepID=UPI001781EFD2|nr:N-6 DNA methylase [Sphingomonas sp. CFBP 8764]MBD8552564.1 N-6 DNA methylase [Sphingomonas sp. CFBP 8764]